MRQPNEYALVIVEPSFETGCIDCGAHVSESFTQTFRRVDNRTGRTSYVDIDVEHCANCGTIYARNEERPNRCLKLVEAEK